MTRFLVSTDATDARPNPATGTLQSMVLVVEAPTRNEALLYTQALMMLANLHKNELTVINIG